MSWRVHGISWFEASVRRGTLTIMVMKLRRIKRSIARVSDNGHMREQMSQMHHRSFG